MGSQKNISLNSLFYDLNSQWNKTTLLNSNNSKENKKDAINTANEFIISSLRKANKLNNQKSNFSDKTSDVNNYESIRITSSSKVQKNNIETSI